ncbi:hypothetical protein BASA81_010729 [Batrachochytrium salamandrivorans]|nr:hypothetical protein BASA81_010729 [Batrachochytrium salamandrivorans]
MSFYSNVFDSKLVVAQIVAMQALSYLSLSGLVFFSHQILPSFPLEVGVLFDSKYLGNGTEQQPTNFTLVLCLVANALCFGIQLSFVVERAKKCLDFCLTYFCLHLVLCAYGKGFPTEWRWWLCQFVCLLVSSLCGEYFCMKKELQEINVKEFLSMRPTTGGGNRNSTSTSSSSSSTEQRRTTSAANKSSANAAADVTLSSLV